MTNQKESKQVRTGSRLLKLLSRDIQTKTKTKDQLTNNHKNNTKIKNKTKIKNMGDTTTIMDHYPRNGQIGNIDPESDMSC